MNANLAADPSGLLVVASMGDQLGLHVPKDRGNDVRDFLSMNDISSRVCRTDDPAFDRLEIDGDQFPEEVQAILNEWQG